MIHINGILILTLQCGLFLLICGSTFGFGLRLILLHVGINNRFAPIFYALLLAIVAFEGTLIGAVPDPRAITLGWRYIFTTAAYIGIGAFLGVIVIGYLYFLLVSIIRWLYGVAGSFFKNQKNNR